MWSRKTTGSTGTRADRVSRLSREFHPKEIVYDMGDDREHRAYPSPSPGDRRAAHRQIATVGCAWLGWREGQEFLVKPAFVLDISMGGCLVAAQVEPPLHRTVLIRLDGPLLPVWFEARVLQVRRRRGGGPSRPTDLRGLLPL